VSIGCPCTSSRAVSSPRGACPEAYNSPMNQRDARLSIPDVQGSPDTRQLAIDRVGIKAIRHPVRIRERAGESSTRSRTSTCTWACRTTSRARTCRASWRS
jgi:hypothetical protein